jgi:hypothetical protein
MSCWSLAILSFAHTDCSALPHPHFVPAIHAPASSYFPPPRQTRTGTIFFAPFRANESHSNTPSILNSSVSPLAPHSPTFADLPILGGEVNADSECTRALRVRLWMLEPWELNEHISSFPFCLSLRSSTILSAALLFHHLLSITQQILH